MAIKVSIYEDNISFLESLSYLIKGNYDFELYFASANANNIIADCEKRCPDVILMDIDMPGMSGIEATMLVKSAFPDINIMMLTVFENKEKIFEALCAGATGYLLKKTSAIELIGAIHDLHNGGSPMSSGIARKVLEYFSKSVITDKRVKDMDIALEKYQLTTREHEILQRLIKGDSYKMIADKCLISIGTVYSHINNVYKKLQVNSKSEAVTKALKERLV
jgi:Response regulator containing a CheY-like receiver domain and an HTH DNA-binding domain